MLVNAPDLANTSILEDYPWSDGFLGSNIRQKDNSVWVMTEKLSLLSEHIAPNPHIGVLAFGWSKNDYQPVFDHFLNEVSELH